MIVLDTNVLSELMRPRPDDRVLAWVDSLPIAELGTTAINAAELRHGVARLAPGHRGDALTAAVREVLDGDFRGRIAPFDAGSAIEFAAVVSARESGGRPIAVADAQIAAICRQLGAPLATRNVQDFDNTDLEIVDPWR